MWWNERFLSCIFSWEICSNCLMTSGHGPKSQNHMIIISPFVSVSHFDLRVPSTHCLIYLLCGTYCPPTDDHTKQPHMSTVQLILVPCHVIVASLQTLVITSPDDAEWLRVPVMTLGFNVPLLKQTVFFRMKNSTLLLDVPVWMFVLHDLYVTGSVHSQMPLSHSVMAEA